MEWINNFRQGFESALNRYKDGLITDTDVEPRRQVLQCLCTVYTKKYSLPEMENCLLLHRANAIISHMNRQLSKASKEKE